jgi:RHS repeat-associated protein
MTQYYPALFSSKNIFKFLLLVLLLLPFLNTNAIAGEYSVFGPRVYLRHSGSPVVETDTISTASPGSSYLLKISNGGLTDDEYELVSSSVITLNGVEILSPNELNQQVDYIEKTVVLQQVNEFSVEVRGKPGGALLIDIVGTDNTPPVITANVSPQANTGGWHNTDVVVSFDCNDALSGIANCPAPVTITAEGAGQVIMGTASDNAGNTAEASVTVNLDKSQPVVNVTSPANGALVTSSTVDIIGQVYDTGSQVTAIINGNAVLLQADGSFSHPVVLVEGLNTITVIVTDSAGNTVESNLSITLQSNQPPVATSLTLLTLEDTALNITLSANDPDGDAVNYQILTQPQHGVLTGVAPNLVYTPNTNYSGADNLTYLVNDGLVDSGVATVSINVQAVNDAPVANDQTVTLNEDTSLNVVLSASDVDNTTLTYSVSQAPSNGVLSGIAPNLIYTPNSNFNGSDSFTFVANDGDADSNTALISLNVSAENDAPVASNQTVSTNEDVALSIVLTGSDVDGDSLNYSITNLPSNGVLSGTAPNLTYTPNNNFSGSDSINYVVSDGQLNSENTLVDIVVVAENDFPVINSQPVTSATVGDVYQYAVNAFDVDSDPLTYSLLESPEGMDIGLVTGTLIWVPTTAQLGEHTIAIQVNDGRGGSVTQSFIITVSEVPNQNPEITSLPLLQGFVNEAYYYQIAAQDLDGDILSYSLTSGPTGMTVSHMTGVVHWVPAADQIGGQTVTVRVDDGKGGYATQSFTINIETGSNVAPVITSNSVINSLPDSLYSYPVIATDANGDNLSYVLTNAPGGMVIHNASGLINWVPSSYEVGDHNVSMRVFDNKGAFDEQNYVLTVALNTAENQGPSITSAPVTFVSQGEVYLYDVDAADPNNDILTYDLIQAPNSMTINPESGEVAWTSDPAIANYSLEFNSQCGIESNNYPLSDLVIKTLTAEEVEGDVSDELIITIEVYNRGLSTNGNALVTLYADPDATIEVGSVPVPQILSNEAVTVHITLNDYSTLTQLFAEIKVDSVSLSGNIPGVSNIWLAGMPDGTIFDRDSAPINSPVLINDVELNANSLSFINVTGGVSNAGYCTAAYGYTCAIPDGESFWNHLPGALNGISDVRAPINAVVGVFLDDSQPDTTPAPEAINFETFGTDFLSLSPKLKQVFFIGDGLTGSGSGEVQSFVIPDGATRLYLGVMDGYGWYNNSGSIDINAVSGGSECIEDNNLAHINLVNVFVSDPHGLSDTQIFSVQTLPVQLPPEITSNSDAGKVNANDTLEFQVVVADGNIGDAFTYTLQGEPEGLSVNASGTIFWLPTESQIGNYVFNITVTDLAGNVADQTIAVEVVPAANKLPVITSSAIINVTAGQSYQYQIEAHDPEGDQIQYQLITSPIGMQISSTGLISWTTTISDIGHVDVVVRVSDAQGLYAEQTYTLVVESPYQQVNQPPSISSVPAYSVWANKSYSYQVIASDVDGDTLVYQLSAAPAGMSINATGYISWLPAIGDIGSHNITVSISDNNGNNVHQSYVLSVYQNGEPVITSVPSLKAIVGNEYNYQLTAADENGDTFTLSMDAGPTGMVFDDQAGIVSWTPAETQIGVHYVVVRVTDDGGATSTQSYSLQVKTPNIAPVITSTPIHSAYINYLYNYQVIAEDHNGDTLSYQLLNAPQGMQIGSNGLVSWDATTEQPGIYAVEIGVSDDEVMIIQSYQIQLLESPEPLSLSVNITPSVIAPGGTATIQLLTQGGYGEINRQLWVDGTLVALDEHAQAQVSSDVIGRHDIFARVEDNTEVQTFSGLFSVSDPSDTDFPTVSLSNINDQDVITAPIQVLGTIYDDNISDWKLYLREQGASQAEYALIAQGNTNLSNSPLGTFDPTLLVNGLYTVVLQATDINEQTSVVSAIVTVEGNLKVGNFSFTVQDVNIPLAGIPVQVNRTYDSRRRNKQGDFGYGWTIDYQNVKVETSRQPGAAWALNTYYGGPLNAIATYCVEPLAGLIATVTLPDDSVETFAVTAVDACHDFVVDLDVELEFTPTGNTLSELRLKNATTVRLVNGNLEILGSGQVYNPSLYVLTTKQGLEYHLDQNFGIKYVVDTNGNTLTYSDSGIVHSSGRSIDFVRNAEGVITQITKPIGNAINYEYDLSGDLVAAGDTDKVQYTYNHNHGLLDIIDPLGRTLLRNIYDGSGRLIAQEDNEGNRTAFTHDLFGRTSLVTDRLGRVTQFAYDERGNVLSTVDALNNLTQYTYDADDNQLSQTDALGNVTTATYDDRRNQRTQTDALGNTIAFTYNQRGQELEITDALNNTFINTYDSVGNLLTVTDPEGNIAGNNINAQGLPTLVRDTGGNDTTFTYDGFGNKLTETDALGNTTTFSYDAMGNVLTQSQQRTDGSGVLVTEVTTNTYDDKNRLISTTDAAGRVVSYSYDGSDNKISETTPAGTTTFEYDVYRRLLSTVYPDLSTETMTYDAEGNLISETDRNGNTTSYSYDALNRQVQTTYADGSLSQSEYDAIGRIIAEIDENGNRTEHEYDAAGRRVLTRDALGKETRFEYDANGNLISQLDANGHTTGYAYDTLDNRIRTLYHDGSDATQAYDALGRVTSKTDQNGLTTGFTYDALGRLISVTDALGNITSYSYDEVGNKLTQTDAEGRTTSWAYDALGREISRTLPLLQSNSMQYDNKGNISQTIDFNGQITQFAYNVNNYLIRVDYHDGSVETFSYDANGNRLSATDRYNQSETWTYDNRNRLTQNVKGNGDQLDYGYDNAGNRTRLTVTVSASSDVTYYGYDALNRLSSVTDSNNQVTDYGYDNVGNRQSISYPNGNTTSYHYDALNRLTQLTTVDSQNNILTDYQYTLDNSGHRTKIIELNGRTSNYVYDDLYRLTTEDISDALNGNYSASYSYDRVGNRTASTINGVSTVYTIDDNDRLLQQGGETFSYDDNGNTLTKTIDGDTVSYGYNVKNELETSTDNITTSSYRYDIDGIRSQKVVNGDITDYLVDANRDYQQVLVESTASGSTSYLYGDDLIKQTKAANDSYYLYDGLGSTRALTDSTGLVTDSYDYESFGSVLNQTGSTENNYLFTGEQFDGGLDNYYLRARYYDQSVGRFTQMDTWMGRNGDPVTLHKYLYANANPVTYVDLSGNYAGVVRFAAVTTIAGILATTTAQSIPKIYFTSSVSTSEYGYDTSDFAIGATVLTSLITSGKEKALICSLFSTILCSESERLKDRLPGYWPGDKGAAEWGRRNGVGGKEGKRRFHKGIKQGDHVSGASDDYSTNPDTGDVVDPEGEYVGNLEDDYN